MPYWLIVIAHCRHWANNLYARGIHGHKNLRLLLMARCVKISFPHHNHNFAVFIHGTAGVPLSPVDNVFVTISLYRRLYICRVTRRNRRLGHSKRRTNFTVKQRLQPLLLLCIVAVFCYYFHIARVWRTTIENFSTKKNTTHFFTQRRILSVG